MHAQIKTGVISCGVGWHVMQGMLIPGELPQVEVHESHYDTADEAILHAQVCALTTIVATAILAPVSLRTEAWRN